MKLLWLITLGFILVDARLPVYSPCNPTNNHLEPSTKEFVSDCDVFGYCSTNGTCLPRQCRKDLYVLASMRNSSFGTPPLCDAGTYCPDDASECLPLVAEGGHCELNRDDECAQSSTNITSLSGLPQTYGTICLLGTCRPADVGLNNSCVIENTTYAGYDRSGSAFDVVVIRDNCIPQQGFCNTTSSTCQALKAFAAQCETDRECTSFNCVDGLCSSDLDEALHVPRWMYALVAFATAGAMAGVLAGLIWLHKRNESSNQIKKQEYYRQQTMFELYRTSSMGSGTGDEKLWRS